MIGLIPVNPADNILHEALSLLGIVSALASDATDRVYGGAGRTADRSRAREQVTGTTGGVSPRPTTGPLSVVSGSKDATAPDRGGRVRSLPARTATRSAVYPILRRLEQCVLVKLGRELLWTDGRPTGAATLGAGIQTGCILSDAMLRSSYADSGYGHR